MRRRRDIPCEEERAGEHPTHESAEQYRKRHRRGAHDELQDLEPDNLVDERRAPGADEEEQHRREITGGASGFRQIHVSVCREAVEQSGPTSRRELLQAATLRSMDRIPGI